jgi:hypothetical protein
MRRSRREFQPDFHPHHASVAPLRPWSSLAAELSGAERHAPVACLSCVCPALAPPHKPRRSPLMRQVITAAYSLYSSNRRFAALAWRRNDLMPGSLAQRSSSRITASRSLQRRSQHACRSASGTRRRSAMRAATNSGVSGCPFRKSSKCAALYPARPEDLRNGQMWIGRAASLPFPVPGLLVTAAHSRRASYAHHRRGHAHGAVQSLGPARTQPVVRP